MKTAICYYSRHHGNTLTVLKAMTEGCDADLLDVTAGNAADLSGYDAVGFASGIYYSKFQKAVISFAEQNLPEGKDVFFVYTCGSMRGSYTNAISDAVSKKGANVLGEYGCLGFDTFGPFKLVGGIVKGHPDTNELAQAKEFYRSICK